MSDTEQQAETNQPDPNRLVTYYLAVFEIFYTTGPKADSIKLNMLIPNPEGVLTRADLGGIQAQAAQNYHEEFDPAKQTSIKQITILNVINLGTMTVDQFNGPAPVQTPEGDDNTEGTVDAG